MYAYAKPRAKKRSKYKLRRRIRKSKRGKKFYRYTVARARKNPMAALKAALPVFAGFAAAKILTKLAAKQLGKIQALSSLPAEVNALLPAGAILLVASKLAPKVLSGSKLSAFQNGAALNLIAAGASLVASKLAAGQTGLVADIAGALAGYDDMGIQGYGYGYGEYSSDPTGYSLPVTKAADVGLDVQEALADYVSEDMGLDVQEALAGHELGYLQEGGAGGTLRRTVFSS